MFKAFKVSSKSHRLETKARSISCVWEFPHRFSESNSGFSSSNRKVNILRFINLWFSWNFQTKIKFLARAQVFLIKNSSCGNNIPTARHVTPACLTFMSYLNYPLDILIYISYVDNLSLSLSEYFDGHDKQEWDDFESKLINHTNWDSYWMI